MNQVRVLQEGRKQAEQELSVRTQKVVKLNTLLYKTLHERDRYKRIVEVCVIVVVIVVLTMFSC